MVNYSPAVDDPVEDTFITSISARYANMYVRLAVVTILYRDIVIRHRILD